MLKNYFRTVMLWSHHLDKNRSQKTFKKGDYDDYRYEVTVNNDTAKPWGLQNV